MRIEDIVKDAIRDSKYRRMLRGRRLESTLKVFCWTYREDFSDAELYALCRYVMYYGLDERIYRYIEKVSAKEKKETQSDTKIEELLSEDIDKLRCWIEPFKYIPNALHEANVLSCLIFREVRIAYFEGGRISDRVVNKQFKKILSLRKKLEKELEKKNTYWDRDVIMSAYDMLVVESRKDVAVMNGNFDRMSVRLTDYIDSHLFRE